MRLLCPELRVRELSGDDGREIWRLFERALRWDGGDMGGSVREESVERKLGLRRSEGGDGGEQWEQWEKCGWVARGWMLVRVVKECFERLALVSGRVIEWG